MKKIILTILLLLISITAYSQVYPQVTRTNTGNVLFRVVNNTSAYISCYYKDNYNYVTFAIQPYSSSQWYPIYGQYQWQCR